MTAATMAFAALGGLVLLLLLWPLARPGGAGGTRRDLAIYRDQLRELERDRERGLIGGSEAAAARAEIERRLLRAGRRQPDTLDASRHGRLVVLATAVLVPLAAGLVYAGLGSPGLPDLPMASRPAPAEDPELASIRTMVTGLEARLAAAPDDLEGWLMLGRSKLVLGDAPGAVTALRTAEARAPDDRRIWANLAEALIISAGGVVTPEAARLLERAAPVSPEDPRIAYYLGLAEQQAGDLHGAIERWRALLAASPADADWRAPVAEALRRAAAELGIDGEAMIAASPGTAPTPVGEADRIARLPAEEQDQAIRSMVERLETRLEESGEDAEGWRRLAQARRVLGEIDAAKAAIARAHELAPDDPAILVDYGQSLLGAADAETRLPEVGDAALAAFEQAARLRPEAPEPQWWLGVRALQDGQPQVARGHWQRVLATLPADHPDHASVKSFLEALPPVPAGPTG